MEYNNKKLEQQLVDARYLLFKEKYGECMTVTSWKKWCESYEFRKNEWEFRQNVAKSVKYGI